MFYLEFLTQQLKFKVFGKTLNLTDLPIGGRPVFRRSECYGAGEEGLLDLLVPLPLTSSGAWAHLIYGKPLSPTRPVAGQGWDGGGLEVFLQNLNPGKGKQGRNHPGQGLCGPYQELGTGHMCSKSRSPWPRRGLMPAAQQTVPCGR